MLRISAVLPFERETLFFGQLEPILPGPFKEPHVFFLSRTVGQNFWPQNKQLADTASHRIHRHAVDLD